MFVSHKASINSSTSQNMSFFSLGQILIIPKYTTQNFCWWIEHRMNGYKSGYYDFFERFVDRSWSGKMGLMISIALHTYGQKPLQLPEGKQIILG